MSFNFGNTGSGGTSAPSQGGVFGTSSTPASSSIFGQSTPATSKPAAGNLFGGAISGSASLFGNTATPQPSLTFGTNTGSKPASGASTQSIFGASTGTTPAAGLFGQAASTTSSAGATGSLFGASGASGGGFNFAAKKDGGTSTTAANQNKPATPGGLFSGLNSTSGSNLFGSLTPSTSTATPAGSTTPAPPNFSIANSTTPAGPPPAENGQAKSLFGSAPSGQQPLFGTAKPAESTQPKPSSLFANLNDGTTKSTSSSSLFNNPSSTPVSSGANASSTTAPASEAPKPVFSFPTAASSTPGTQASTSVMSPAATTAPLFGGTSTPSTSAAPNMFASLSQGTTNASTSAAPPTSTSTSAPSKSLFGNLGATSGTSSASPSTSTSAPDAKNLFGQPASGSSTQPPSSSGTAAPGATNTTNTQASTTGPSLGSSTSGPTPQQSRLKNKTMDEIITRWASDLLKYQKDFQEQAAKVATWDRLLVENGEKIQTLADNTHEAERATREIESQLSNVEGQQAELTSWLDRYEADIDEMFVRQVGPGENLQGPDQERERTYKIAEKLTDRLDEMGKNITSMIEAINDASTNVSKNAKADDPLSHIVRVLNSHLTQLQWIDQNTELLQAKVNAAQKLGQSISSNGTLENDAAESFYRSYSSRR